MKHCVYCKTDYDSSYTSCVSCGAVESVTKCDNCGNVHDSAFCPNCGVGVNEVIKTCPKCGNKTSELFCAKCGHAFVAPNAPIARMGGNVKLCKFCGHTIHAEAVLCPHCGRQVEYADDGGFTIAGSPQQVFINNYYGGEYAEPPGRRKNKWVAVILCFFFGIWGVHKFYEGRIVLGVLYILTVGLFFIGVFIDLIVLLCKPNPYYV